MRVGDWEVRSCLAGRFRLDGGAMFGVVPKTLWSKAIPADEQNRIPMVMRPMLIAGKGKTILVDVGAGSGYGGKYESIYAFEHSRGLFDSLGALDIDPEDVTDVVLTHLHFDHAGGVAAPSGDGWGLVFPKAVHHVQKAQYDHALDPNPRDRASYFRERIEILEHGNVMMLHDGPWTLCPGIDLITTHGHTPGQQLVKISSGSTTVLYCADLIPTSAHIPIPYIMAYDLDPVLSMEEKEPVLERAYEERWLLYFEHDPSVISCYLGRENKRFVPGETVEL